MLQEIYETVGYTPAHLEKAMTRSQVQLTPGHLGGTPSTMSRALLTPSRLHMTPSVSAINVYHQVFQVHPQSLSHLSQHISKHTLQEDDAGHQKCLFVSHLMLETDELYFEPSKAEFQEAIDKILSAFQDCTLGFPNLIPDSYFHSFTRYNNNNCCGLRPCVEYTQDNLL